MVDELTFSALKVEVLREGTTLGAATAFVMESNGQNYLLTNWHVVTGRNPEKPSDIERAEPTHLKTHYCANRLQSGWVERVEPLRTADGMPRWKEHPSGPPIDVVALPISADGIFLHRLSWNLVDADLEVTPSEPVSVIGFPFGLASSGMFPIWKTGHLASDLDLDYEGRPAFLIDVTTKEGMSGSPVIAKRVGTYVPRSVKDTLATGDATRFLGVYSGRRKDTAGIRDGYNLGIVWKITVVRDIFA